MTVGVLARAAAALLKAQLYSPASLVSYRPLARERRNLVMHAVGVILYFYNLYETSMEGRSRGAKRGKGEGMTRERVDVYKSYSHVWQMCPPWPSS